MDEDEPVNAEDSEAPAIGVHTLASGLSEANLMAWYIRLIKRFGMLPWRVTTQKKEPAVSKGRNKRQRADVEEEVDEDDDEVIVGGAGQVRPAKKTKVTREGGEAAGR